MKEKPIKKVYAVNIKQETKEATDKLTDNFSMLVGELLEKYIEETKNEEDESAAMKSLKAELKSIQTRMDDNEKAQKTWASQRKSVQNNINFIAGEIARIKEEEQQENK